MITTSSQSAKTKENRENLLAYGSVFVIWAASIWLSLLPKNTEALKQYKLTASNLHIIQISLSLPTLFIWCAILFAALSFYRYSRQIAGSKESPAYRYIGYGLTYMFVGSIVGSFINSIRAILSENANDPQQVKTHFVIIANYIAVASALGLYYYLFKGGKTLLGTAIKGRIHPSKYSILVVVPFLVVAISYLFLIFDNPNRRMSTNPKIVPSFGLPDALILLTVALPYLLSWFLGFIALASLYRYQAATAGVFYKQLFKKLVNGMTMVIALTIALQVISQFATFFVDKNLSFILQFIAVIYIIIIVGLVLVARAARQLNKIETLDLTS